MREGFFGGDKNNGKQPLDAMVDDMSLDEMAGQIEPEGKEFEKKMDREAKRIFEELGFRVGNQVKKDFSANSGTVKKGVIINFTYAINPQAIFLARVMDESGASFAITPEEILEGKVKKI